MIKNERQYRITKSRVQKFTQTLVHLDAHPQEPPPFASASPKGRAGWRRESVRDFAA